MKTYPTICKVCGKKLMVRYSSIDLSNGNFCVTCGIRNACLGKTYSDEHRKKISERLKGRRLTAEHCKKISLGNKGRKQTPEAIENIAKGRLYADGTSSFNHLYNGYKGSAQQKGYEFSISKSLFRILTSCNCYYCGSPPSNEHIHTKSKRVKPYKFNGLDRFDNRLGYDPSNLVPCCKTCNYGKRKLTDRDFLSWVDRVYYHSLGSGVP